MGVGDLTDASHDVCIVGAGPVGIALALELSRLGARSLLLESGGTGEDSATQQLSDAAIVDPSRHDPMRMAVSRRLGGTSHLWGGRCLPYDRIDFEPRQINGDAAWPIGYDDLVLCYGRAVEYACAGAPVFETDELASRDRAFETSHLERWSVSKIASRAHGKALAQDAAIDLRLHATVVAFEWSAGRIEHAIVVDREGRRTAIPVKTLVLATGGLESTRLLLSEQRRAPARFGGPDGPLGRTYMGHIIGEIADVTIADPATDSAFDFRIDDHGSYVRRRITPSPALLRENNLLNCAFWPVVPPIADASHQDGFLSAVALALSVEPFGRRVLPEAIRRRHIPAAMIRLPHMRNVIRDLPAAIAELPTLLWRRYGATIPAPAFYKRNAARRYGLAYHSEQAPRSDSRVWLGDDRDRTGLPRLRIDLRFSRADARSVVSLHEHLAKWLKRTGLGQLHYRSAEPERVDRVLEQASHGTHQIGTARMSATPQSGVVDADLRCWGVDNLYVASSAVLPTSGQANPTLTVMALAMRLAERLTGRRTSASMAGERPPGAPAPHATPLAG